jgi:hypothetical protein
MCAFKNRSTWCGMYNLILYIKLKIKKKIKTLYKEKTLIIELELYSMLSDRYNER